MRGDDDFDDPPLYSQISESLWQGGTYYDDTTIRGRKRLPTLNDPKPFDSVVSLCAHSMPFGWLVKEMRYAFADGPAKPELYAEIERLADWAYAEWKDGKRVLIRCQAGMNRSSLVTALVLMRSGLSPEAAIALIRKQRSPYVFSNKDFLDYVESWKKP
jgi:hypothetical protein